MTVTLDVYKVPATPFPVPPPRMVRRILPASAVVSTALAVVAAVCCWALLQFYVLGAVSFATAQDNLHDRLRLDLAAQTAPLGGDIEPGTPVALLEIPSLGLSQVVVEGTSSGDLLSGPGHLRRTTLPGQGGTSVILGRNAGYGAPFREIAQLGAGDGIRVTTAQGEWVYRIDRVRREGDPLPVPAGKGQGRLTLVTAEGRGALGALDPTGTIYVDATLQAQPAVPEKGRPAKVPEAEEPMGVDDSGVPLLAVTTAGLLLTVLGMGSAARRAQPRIVWLLGAPVLALFAWLSGELAVRLLPNIA